MKARLIGSSNVGARVVKLKIGSEAIVDNCRVLTSTDLRHNQTFEEAKLTLPKYRNPVLEYRRNFIKSDIIKLRKDNKYFTNKANELKLFFNNGHKLNIFRPIMSDEYVILEQEDYNALIDLATYSKADAIALPANLSPDLKQYESILVKSREHVETNALDLKKNFTLFAPLPIIDKFDVLKAKSKIIQNNGFECINIINDHLINFWKQYSYLREFLKDKDFCVYGSNTPKFLHGDWKTAIRHVYAFMGQNMISTDFRMPFLGKGQRSVHDLPKDNIKLFDASTNGYLTRGEFNLKYGESLDKYQDIPFCNGKNLTSFYDAYQHEMLRKISKSIEAIKSNEAFEEESKAIMCNEFKDLMMSKEYMKPWVGRVLQTTLNVQ